VPEEEGLNTTLVLPIGILGRTILNRVGERPFALFAKTAALTRIFANL
jgi:hypothetical protein